MKIKNITNLQTFISTYVLRCPLIDNQYFYILRVYIMYYIIFVERTEISFRYETQSFSKSIYRKSCRCYIINTADTSVYLVG